MPLAKVLPGSTPANDCEPGSCSSSSDKTTQSPQNKPAQLRYPCAIQPGAPGNKAPPEYAHRLGKIGCDPAASALLRDGLLDTRPNSRASGTTTPADPWESPSSIVDRSRSIAPAAP